MRDASEYLTGIKKWRYDTKDRDVSNDYFIFLFNITELEDKYMKLCEILHGINVTFDEDDVPMDENRIWDGKAMRSIFCEAMFPSSAVKRRLLVKELDNCFDRDYCSVLEVFIGLAWRIERDVIGDPDEGDRTSFWVRCILHNLELLDYTDKALKTMDDKKEVVDIVLKCINRDYDRFGNGSAFPVRYPRRNMKYMEMWNQMVQWLDEEGYC